MPFRLTIARLLAAERFEREHQARVSDYANVKAALDEAKVRARLGYEHRGWPLKTKRPADG